MAHRLLPLFAALSLFPCSIIAQSGVSRDEYLAYCISAADQGWNDIDASRAKWKESIDLNYVFGYNPPGNDVYLAALCANLAELTGEIKYVDRAKSLLLYYGHYKEAYPADYYKSVPEYAAGLPALPNIFSFPKYLRAYEVLKNRGNLSPAERRTIEQNIAESADFIVNFQEWGPMNRGMLRAEVLSYAAKLLPDHPHSQVWSMMGKAIGDDSWGQWEIEDATGYHGVWLYSLLGYASDVREDESLHRTPVMNYYFQYFLALMSPAGLVPDFGDANWASGWDRMIPFFEKGASVYRDPHLRWAAEQIFQRYVDPQKERKGMFLALLLSDAVRWGDFSIVAISPTSGSQQVLDDLVGKKIVFRDGWSPNSTYLLYNYRDEGDGGWLFREYLRTSIPVEEEKMHHGHSDENSIVLLMKNGSVLLHDGGYRDYMPSGPYGAYRADYFHNRLVVREGKIALGQRAGQYRYASPGREAVPGQSMLDFFCNSGAHHNVRTQKIDFLSLDHFDMTRTRLLDDHLGYEADRVVNYIKDLDWFVVFDVVRFTKPGYLTMANLWHTRKVLQSGPGWFDTAYDSLGGSHLPGDERLLIFFPDTAHMELGVEPQHRHYQQEQVAYQLIGRHGYLNDLQVFVTVLIPHGSAEDPGKLVRSVQMVDNSDYPHAVSLRITAGGKTYLVAAKMDLQQELVRDWRRPMYTYDSGKVRYGKYETDAYHLFVVEDGSTIDYVMAGGVKITYDGQVLHEQKPVTAGLAFDGSKDRSGTGKVRYWHARASR
jgi:hypothetical protein